MSVLSLRLPESLHKIARELAKEENISINQLITLALAEKIATLKTEQVFAERAKKSDRAQYLRVLAKVPDVGSAVLDLPESDQLPAQYARHRLNQTKTTANLAE